MPWKLPFKELERIERILREDNFDVVENTCEAIREEARRLVPSPSNPGPHASGATSESIYVSTTQGSDYSARKAVAESLTETEFMPEVKPDFSLADGVVEGVVASSTIYSAAIEYGLFDAEENQYRAAHPFLEPATEAHLNTLQDEQKKVLRKCGFR